MTVSRRQLGVLGATVLLIVLGAVALVPRHAPGLRHTSVLNVLFDSRWVVGGTRLVGFAAGLYVVASIVVRVSRDQWLRQVGSADVETSRSVVEVTRDRAELQAALDRAEQTIARLSAEYASLLAAQEHTGRGREQP